MTVVEQVRSVRTRAGLLELPRRGVLAVRGDDRVRWLNGMLSNEVEALRASAEGGEGCPALLLNPKAGIIASLHVLAHEEEFWLDAEKSAIPEITSRLERYIVADDVRLEALATERFSVEGPQAFAFIEGLASGALPAPHSGAWSRLTIAAAPVVVAAYSFAGEPGLQLFAEPGKATVLRAALSGLPSVSAEAQEILRIESGLPLEGRELGEDVLPDEAHLGDAISTVKGCYTGQEIIARLRSRGQVNHLMVGLRFAGGLPELGAELRADERSLGEVTSCCDSPDLGPIGLGFVRRSYSEPGCELECAGSRAVVTALPQTGDAPRE